MRTLKFIAVMIPLTVAWFALVDVVLKGVMR
jgi:hypothetical protein